MPEPYRMPIGSDDAKKAAAAALAEAGRNGWTMAAAMRFRGSGFVAVIPRSPTRQSRYGDGAREATSRSG